MPGFLAQKLSELIFGTDDELSMPEARRKVGLRFGVSRQEFRPFTHELEALGIAKFDGNGQKRILKKVLP